MRSPWPNENTIGRQHAIATLQTYIECPTCKSVWLGPALKVFSWTDEYNHRPGVHQAPAFPRPIHFCVLPPVSPARFNGHFSLNLWLQLYWSPDLLRPSALPGLWTTRIRTLASPDTNCYHSLSIIHILPYTTCHATGSF